MLLQNNHTVTLYKTESQDTPSYAEPVEQPVARVVEQGWKMRKSSAGTTRDGFLIECQMSYAGNVGYIDHAGIIAERLKATDEFKRLSQMELMHSEKAKDLNETKDALRELEAKIETEKANLEQDGAMDRLRKLITDKEGLQWASDTSSSDLGYIQRAVDEKRDSVALAAARVLNVYRSEIVAQSNRDAEQAKQELFEKAGDALLKLATSVSRIKSTGGIATQTIFSRLGIKS